MQQETESAIFEGRAGRREPPVTSDLAEDSMIHAKLWHNPCWFSFRLNFLALHFNNPVYGFIQQRLGLLRPEFVVLWSLHLGGCAPFSEVVRSSGFPKNTLSRAANKLVERGMITRETDPDDQRRVTLCLTQSGHDAVAVAKSGMIRHERRMLDCLSPAERLSLSEILTKLVLASGDWPVSIDPETEKDRQSAGTRNHPPKREFA